VGTVYASVSIDQGISAQTSQLVEAQIAGLRQRPDAGAGPIALGILHSVLPSHASSLAYSALRTSVGAEATVDVDPPDLIKNEDSFEPW